MHCLKKFTKNPLQLGIACIPICKSIFSRKITLKQKEPWLTWTFCILWSVNFSVNVITWPIRQRLTRFQFFKQLKTKMQFKCKANKKNSIKSQWPYWICFKRFIQTKNVVVLVPFDWIPECPVSALYFMISYSKIVASWWYIIFICMWQETNNDVIKILKHNKIMFTCNKYKFLSRKTLLLNERGNIIESI